MELMTGPLRKINRAKEHLDLLHSEIKAFGARRPYHIAFEGYTKDGSYVVSPYLKEPLFPSWGILVGEASHALRSALDNIAWQVATKQCVETEFPISMKDIDSISSKLELLRADVWNQVDAVQPYKRPERERRLHPLWILRRIDIIDKHRVILPVVAKIAIKSGPETLSRDGFTRLNKGDVRLKISGRPPQSEKDLKPDFTLEITFDISEHPRAPDDLTRISVGGLYLIHDFVRNDVYPRFAHLLKAEDSVS